MGWPKEWYQQHLAKIKATAEAPAIPIHRPNDGMNKLELAWSQMLDLQAHTKDIVRWKYQAVRLELATRTTYTPDFYVLLPDGRIRFDETKGFMRDDANVKIKVAAALYHEFEFRLITRQTKKDGGGWNIRVIR